MVELESRNTAAERPATQQKAGCPVREASWRLHTQGPGPRAQGREASLLGVESGSQASWKVSSGLQAFPVPQAGLANSQAYMLDGMTGVAGDPK